MCLISGIEPADDSPPLPTIFQTPAVSHVTSSTTSAVISEVVTSFPVPEAKDTETTLASKLKFTATTGKTKFSAVTTNTTLPDITLSSYISSQSAEMTSFGRTTGMSVTAKSNVSLSSLVATSETSTKTQLISSGSTKLLRATEPYTVTATRAVTRSTGSEGKPISTFTRTPITLRTTELPVKTKIMEISEIAMKTLPTKDAQVKTEGLTTFTPPSFESRTEKTTAHQPRYSTLPLLFLPSYTSSVNLTGTSERTEVSIGKSSTTVGKVTVTSFSPVITTLSLLKPASSETTKTTNASTEQSGKTVFLPTSTLPVSLGEAITEPPIEMVHHLTDTAGVPFTTTLGPKKTTLQTPEKSLETTVLPFTIHGKETLKTTSHVKHTSSSYLPPYSLRPSSKTEKSTTLSPKGPSVSVPTPALGELKKTFKTVSTTGYPSHIVLNITELLTTLYTKYPALPETTRVTPLSIEVTSKITSPFELVAKSTLFSGKTFTEYTSPLALSTVKTSTSAYSGNVTTSAKKTFISSKETTPVPFIATTRESDETASFTGSPRTPLRATETTLLTTQPEESEVERISSISPRKPSAFPSSQPSSLISLNLSLPSLPTYGKEASLTALSPIRTTSHEPISSYPRTTITKSKLGTEKTSSLLTSSTLSTIAEHSSPITTVPYDKLPGRAILNTTYAIFSPSSEFSIQHITTKAMSDKEKSTLATSAVLPLTKSHAFSTSQYLADKSVSSPSLTQVILEVITTPKYPVETKVVSTALKSTVKSITDTVKSTASTVQKSFTPSSVGSFPQQTSSGDKLPAQTTKAVTILHFLTETDTKLAHQTSKPSLTGLSSTPIYQHPAETLAKSTDQPQILLSTTEAMVELTSSPPLTTFLPKGVHSSVLSTSLGPTQVILQTEKELRLTDSVTQPYVPKTSILRSTGPDRKTADLTFGTRILPSSPEVLATSSSTIKKDAFPSLFTQKADTGVKFTWQSSVAESLLSSQTPETTTISPEFKPTSSFLLPETTEIPIVMGSESSIGAFFTPVISTASTSMGKSATEKTAVLPKQVTHSTTAYSSTSLASTEFSAAVRTSAAASASSVMSSTEQNITIISATSDKAKAVTESITTSVKPSYFSVTSKAKEPMSPATEKSEEMELLTEMQPVRTQGVTVTSEIPQTFYSPYFTNITAASSNVSVSGLSTIHSSFEPKPSSIPASLASTTKTSKLGITSEIQTPSVSSLFMIPDHSNVTTAPSVSSFAYLSTKPLYGLTTTFSDGLSTVEAMLGVTTSTSILPRETATLQTCTVSNIIHVYLFGFEYIWLTFTH